MSNKEVKDVAQSVLVRLKNQAKSSGISYQMGLQLFFQEEFLRRLSISKYNENFILKGGMFIYTLTNFKSKATQDIDFLMCRLSNDLDNISSIMEKMDLPSFNVVIVEIETFLKPIFDSIVNNIDFTQHWDITRCD
jgi:predicted nucleotidyltransferase component of viral defense system